MTAVLVPVARRPHGRLPVEPLIRAHGGSLRGLARSLNIDPTQVSRAKRAGITWDRADTWACQLGLHPMELWGEAWLTTPTYADELPELELNLDDDDLLAERPNHAA